MSSQDIELQYQQNPSGTMMFTTQSFSYELNFSGELQTVQIKSLYYSNGSVGLSEVQIYLKCVFRSHDSEEPVHKHHQISATT